MMKNLGFLVLALFIKLSYMKIMRRLLIPILLVALIITSCEKEDLNNDCKKRFYYYGSEKINLIEIPNMASISFYETLSEEIINEILEPYPEIEILVIPSNGRHAILSIDSKNCIQTDNLFATIKNDIRISNCNKFFISDTGATFGITDVFVCQLKSSTTQNQLMNLITDNKLEIIMGDTSNSHYILRADKNASSDALDMANIFYESGYFEYAEPDFFADYGTF